ncbi:MAG: cofactor assembly of complex C subunit B [Pleurocapsa sp.]
MNKSDPNRVLRLLPIVVGGLAELLLLVNRLLTVQLTDSQARSDALGVIEGAILILVGLIWQQIQAKPPETVTLVGESGLELDPKLPEPVRTELAWATHLLLTNTVTRAVAVYYQDKTLLRRGVLGKKDTITPGAILQRVLTTGKPVYLVNLALYPGKYEFDYLPKNTQGVICQPIGNQGVLILGANAPRSYTKQDEKWIEGIADKLAETLRAIA